MKASQGIYKDVSETQRLGRPKKPQRPDIYRYHSCQSFLKDWFEYLRALDPEFSLRGFSARAELGAAYLPMVLAGKRKLSLNIYSRIAPLLGLKPPELGHLENLVKLQSSSQTTRLIALTDLSRRATYQRRNPAEAELYRYMSHWHYIAIRELASLPDFRADAEWIQKKLRNKLPLSQIKEALDFLIGKSYIVPGENGAVTPPKDTIKCVGEVYLGALTQYHRQMFALAADSIDNATPQERNLIGITFPTNPECYDEAVKILERAIAEISALEKKVEGARTTVHHAEIAIFPLTQATDEKERK